MSFYDEFADELPDRDVAGRILDWMSRHPKTVEGVIDLAGGTIVPRRPAGPPPVLLGRMVLLLGALMTLISQPKLPVAGLAGPPGPPRLRAPNSSERPRRVRRRPLPHRP